MSIEWDGKGVPPVDCECEALTNGEWRKVMVCYIGEPAGETEALVFDLNSTRPFWGDEFRPIRTKAERRRESSIDAICDILRVDRDCGARINLVKIYEAIAAGKIPGIRLTDD